MINVLAVIVAAVVSMIIGMIWYGPLFGKKWMSLMGMKMPKDKKMPMMPMVMQFVASLVMLFVLAYFISYSGALTMMGALKISGMAWLGFIAANGISSVAFENKPMELYLIGVGCMLVTLLAGGAIIAVMG